MQRPPSIREEVLPRAHSWISVQTLAVFGVIALVPLLFWPSTVALIADWTDLENLGGTHGLLVLATTVWMLLSERQRIGAATARPSTAGFVGLAISCVLWLVLNRAALQEPHASLLPGLMLLAVLAAFGRDVTRVVLFPVGFLFFAMPIWHQVKGPLQWLTVEAVGVLVWITGLPAYIEGISVTVPSGRFLIEGGCSGHHFFVVGLAIAAFYGELTYSTLRVRLKLLALMAVFALICNWLRVFFLIVIGHVTEMQHSLITGGHYWYGWSLFVVALVIYLWVIRRYPEGTPPVVPAAPERQSLRPAILAAVVGLLAAAPIASSALEASDRGQANEFELALPNGRDGWSGPDSLQLEGWEPHYVGANAHARATYSKSGGATVEVVTFAYSAQRQGAELIAQDNSIVGKAGVDGEPALDVEDTATVTTHDITFDELVVTDNAGERWVIRSTYVIGGRPIASARKAQLWYGLTSLAGAPLSAILAVRAQCLPDCDAARQTLDEFTGVLGSSLAASLEQSH
jgi:EpsI family protein